MAIPENYYLQTFFGNHFYFNASNRTKAVAKAKSIVRENGLKVKNIEYIRQNRSCKAYKIYYEAISEYGINNNATGAANKKGFNWTCDCTEMWYEAVKDFNEITSRT